MLLKTKPAAQAWLYAALVLTPCFVTLRALAQTVATKPADAGETKKEENIVVLEKFVASDESLDPTGIMPNKPLGSAFGFEKTLVETPRAITIVSQQQLDSIGIRNAEDLVKVAPGTFS